MSGRNLEKAVVTLVSKNKLAGTIGKEYLKYSIAVDDEYYFITSFSGAAKYLSEYAIVGAKLFFEDWNIKKTEKDGRTYYDFIASKVSIIKNGGIK